MKNFKRIILVLIGLLVLAACGGAQEAESVSEASIMTDEVMADETMADDDAMMAEEGHDDDTDDAMMAEEDHDDDMSEEDRAMDSDEMAEEPMSEGGDDAMMAEDSMENMAELPAWQQLELTDARTGETFTLADFSGKTVFVEPMATWCTNCRRQLGNVREARAQLNDDNVVFIGLSLETTISNADLAQYQSDQGFDWTFAVMSPEILQQLADAFGRSITSAPSTPHFVIRPDGSTTDLVTGIESVEQIAQQILDASG